MKSTSGGVATQGSIVKMKCSFRFLTSKYSVKASLPDKSRI
jgi:hypothetical protein